MAKIILIIFAVYILYYAGNIVYDLFLKKEKALKTDESTEVFSMQQFASENQPEAVQVGIDDVENMQTPTRFFVKDETEIFQNEIFQNESEEEEEIPISENENEQDTVDTDLKTKFMQSLKSLQTEKVREEKREFIPVSMNQERWNDFINLAATQVQLAANVGGHKVYKSDLFNQI
jgi:hypothetical protein